MGTEAHLYDRQTEVCNGGVNIDVCVCVNECESQPQERPSLPAQNRLSLHVHQTHKIDHPQDEKVAVVVTA